MDRKTARVYSYLRFSDPRQSSGHSAERQVQYARTWAADRGLHLDESLSLRDEGLSAYHQRHVKQGALGVFLRAADEGRIPIGSVLVVEGLDRLSRAEPIQAQAQLAQIISAGITVVTASDGREYNRETLKAQPMDLVYSLLVMIRAYEESDTKSKRVKAAIRRQCEGWVAGTYRGLIRNGSDPHWLRWNGETWEQIPERVEAVRYALQLYRQGMGALRAARLMSDAGHVLSESGVNGLQLYRLVKLLSLKGIKRLEIDGEKFQLDNYYPRLLSDAEFDELQELAGQRYRRRGKGDIPGIITGVGITWCGYCGTTIAAQNLAGGRSKVDGRVLNGSRRVHCTSYSKNIDCKAGTSSVVPLERALMAYCSDQINLQRLQESTCDDQLLRDRVATARRRVEEVDQQLARVTEALLADDSGAAPLVFVRKARELEQQLEQCQAELQQAERNHAGHAAAQAPAGAERWATLAAGVEAMDYAAREQVRQLVMDTFERIVIYMRGMNADRANRNIDVLLLSRAGQRRLLRIDRRSGEWLASEDW